MLSPSFVAMTVRTLATALLVTSLGISGCSAEKAPKVALQKDIESISRILVIGDSISLGQGAGGKGPDCPLSDETNREDLAYPALLAKKTNAELIVLAHAGRGLVRNYNDMPGQSIQDWLGPPDYRRLPGPDAAPDLVLVHVGTNDFHHYDPGPEFELAYTALIRHLLITYPKAQIVALIGPMLDDQDRGQAAEHIQAALASARENSQQRIDFILFDPKDQPNVGIGCQWHPSAKMQQAMADRILAQIVHP